MIDFTEYIDLKNNKPKIKRTTLVVGTVGAKRIAQPGV